MKNNHLAFTTTAVKAIEPIPGEQTVFWDKSIVGLGLRVSGGGTKTFFFQGRVNGRTSKVTIGQFGKLTVKQAQDQARIWSADMVKGINPAVTASRKRKEWSAGREFGALMLAYCDDLERQGKSSATAVRNSVLKNIKSPYPSLWRRPASEVDLDDCMKVVSRLVKADKKREADKVRAYIRAAFAAAINARQDASASQSLREFKLSVNPARELRKVKGSTQANDRAMSLQELRSYWRHIAELPEPKRSVLRFHLLTGGQRIAQLQRVTLSDVLPEDNTFIIWDGKGRRDQPRKHVIPLIPAAAEAMFAMGAGPYVFTLNGGQGPVSSAALSAMVSEVSGLMEAAGELEGTPLKPKVIRATIETRLAALKVSSDVLAHLLSHGMGGVQAKHYQRHDFSEEKREALVLLWSALHPNTKVISIKGEAQ